MAPVENLEIIVDVNIAEAIEDLEKLKDELNEVALQIERVDKKGTEGISINTRVDEIDDDLAKLRAKIEAFESTTDLDIDTDTQSAFPSTLSSRAVSAGNIGGGGGMPPIAEFAEMLSDGDVPNVNLIEQRRGGGDGGRRGLVRRLRNLKSSIGDTLGNMSEFDLRMTDMHNALATLVPMLIVFIGVVPTAYAALATLAAAAFTAAGALAAIGGLGLLGAAGGGQRPSMENIQEELSEVVDMFWEAFAPLAEALAPVFEDALDGLERFFEAIAAEGDALMTLVDEMRAFGGFVMDFFPSMLRTLSATLEALAPLFAAMGDFLGDEFQSIMRDLVRVTLEAAPVLAQLAMEIGNMLMALSELGVGFAQVALIAVKFIGLIADLFALFGIGREQLGFLIGATLMFASAVALANTALIKFAASGLKTAIVGIYNFWAGIIASQGALSIFSTTTLVQAIKSLGSFVVSVLTGSASLMALASSALTATGAVAALMTILTLGAAIALVGVATSIATSFFTMADGIDQATSSLKEFDRVAGRTEGTDFNPYEGDVPAGARSGSGASRAGSGGGVTINYESQNDTGDDQSNLDKTAWRASRTTGDT